MSVSERSGAMYRWVGVAIHGIAISTVFKRVWSGLSRTTWRSKVATWVSLSILAPSLAVVFVGSAVVLSGPGSAAAAGSPKITVVKSVAGRVAAADQFTVALRNGATTLTSATTAGAGTSATTTNWPVSAQSYQITDAMAAGSTNTLAAYVPTISCIDTSTNTAAAVTGSAPSWTLTVTGSEQFVCTVTNTPAPRLTVSKVTLGGVGAFPISGTNGYTAVTITTVTAGAPVAAPTRTLTTPGIATTLTETAPAGWAMTAGSCTGLGAGGTATPNLAAQTIALDAAATVAGSNIACTFRIRSCRR